MSEEIKDAESVASKASDYFKSWYALNKERLSQKRKERYRNDPDYKAKVLQSASVSRKRVSNADAKKFVTVAGVDYEVHPIATVASRIKISRETLLNWEGCGLLPETPFRLTGRAIRCYTDGMISVLGTVVESWNPSAEKKRIHIRKTDTAFTGAISEGWNLLPEIQNRDISLDSIERN